MSLPEIKNPFARMALLLGLVLCEARGAYVVVTQTKAQHHAFRAWQNAQAVQQKDIDDKNYAKAELIDRPATLAAYNENMDHYYKGIFALFPIMTGAVFGILLYVRPRANQDLPSDGSPLALDKKSSLEIATAWAAFNSGTPVLGSEDRNKTIQIRGEARLPIAPASNRPTA